MREKGVEIAFKSRMFDLFQLSTDYKVVPFRLSKRPGYLLPEYSVLAQGIVALFIVMTTS